MEEIAVRSWDNPIIRESYNWMLKVGRELREDVVLVGGWGNLPPSPEVEEQSSPILRY